MDALDLGVFDADALATIADGKALPDSVGALDALAEDFNASVVPKEFGFGPKDYWHAFATEMRLLICGGEGSAKYADLRRKLAAHGKKSQTALVSTIAVFVGSEISVEAALLTPYVAIFLAVAIRLGREALCEAIRGDGR